MRLISESNQSASPGRGFCGHCSSSSEMGRASPGLVIRKEGASITEDELMQWINENGKVPASRQS